MTARPYLSGIGGRMIDLPHRGNLLSVQCRACEHEARISGRQIVLDFTCRLSELVADWAASLRCSQCDSRYIRVAAYKDPGAQAFHLSAQDTGPIVWCRRLNAYLAEVGTDLWEYLDVLSDMPSDAELAKAAIVRPSMEPC